MPSSSSIIDEAQNLSLPLIEETRILSDTFGAEGRLQIVFVGQPELHAKLKLPEMRQVDQRVCGYHRLAPMSRDAVAGYIQHRLQVAGGRRDRVLFPPEIVDGLHRRSGGVPRLINRICDRALQLAYERQAEGVNREILDTALIEVGAATLSPTWDSIIFAEPPTPPPAAAPAPTPRHRRLRRRGAVDQTMHGGSSSRSTTGRRRSRRSTRRFRRRTGRPLGGARACAALAQAAVHGVRPTRRRCARVTTDWPRDLRSETYLHRLWRMWAKRAAIAVAVLDGHQRGHLGRLAAARYVDAARAPVAPRGACARRARPRAAGSAAGRRARLPSPPPRPSPTPGSISSPSACSPAATAPTSSSTRSRRRACPRCSGRSSFADSSFNRLCSDRFSAAPTPLRTCGACKRWAATTMRA